MAVVIETTLGDITVDLYLEQRPVTCLNFLKLCKMKYYNFNLFHSIRSGFIAQTGDPSGEGSGGQSVFGLLEGPDKRFFSGEKRPKIRHNDVGLLSMVGTGDMMIGSQFFLTLAPDLDSLDDVHCVIGEVTEGHEVLRKLNDVICDETHRPYRDVRITHTTVLEDPFNDPVGLRAPSRSPSPSAERLKNGRIAPDEEIDETLGKSAAEIQEMLEEKEAKARATILEIVGDLPDADIAPPENVLFVCKLNPVTTDDDLEIIFSRFGKIVSCEVIRDKKTGDSLQYAFIEFAEKKSCEEAYFKMGNVLIDDRRIHVDFSQSVSKMRWLGKGRGVKYLNDDDDKSYQTQKETSKRSRSKEKEYKNRESDGYYYNNKNKYENKDREHERENRRPIRNRSRSPIHTKSSRNYRNDENSHSHSKTDTNKRDRHNSNKDLNNSSRRNHGPSRLASLPKDRKEDRLKYHRRSRSRDSINEAHRGSNNDRSVREDRSRQRPEERINHYKSDQQRKRRNSYDDKTRDEKREQNDDKRHENNKSVSRVKKENNERTHSKGNTKADSENTNSKKRKHVEEEIKEYKKSKRSESIEHKTPSPSEKNNGKTSKIKGKQIKKQKQVSKKKRKPSTSSDSSSESSLSSESSSSTDSDRKRKPKHRRKKRYSTSSSSSSETSTSSSSSSSTESSSSSSSSSDSDTKKKCRNKKKK